MKSKVDQQADAFALDEWTQAVNVYSETRQAGMA